MTAAAECKTNLTSHLKNQINVSFSDRAEWGCETACYSKGWSCCASDTPYLLPTSPREIIMDTTSRHSHSSSTHRVQIHLSAIRNWKENDDCSNSNGIKFTKLDYLKRELQTFSLLDAKFTSKVIYQQEAMVEALVAPGWCTDRSICWRTFYAVRFLSCE